MSALAEALLDFGAAVSGSDMVESEATRDLRARGARISYRPQCLESRRCHKRGYYSGPAL